MLKVDFNIQSKEAPGARFLQQRVQTVKRKKRSLLNVTVRIQRSFCVSGSNTIEHRTYPEATATLLLSKMREEHHSLELARATRLARRNAVGLSESHHFMSGSRLKHRSLRWRPEV
ncbi:hypothetical protein SERLA73DRAFT_181445 [Serpula lacrymans var. lacrymans S7.3]|uniref:Uncharacterized protein n=1 Tax=Serpula lacrymans var. lacrymans (strain S7.3) TaxID=936435 RepID=F8PY39_SERL3|nr:hypothetical protein SERLA73DRAFT_181445 [Serpula lacrymans var. lacrymans S7.3]